MGAFDHIVLVNLVFLLIQWVRGWVADPITGPFIQLPLNTSNFHIQKPYDLPVWERYSFVNGIHKLWVYSTDNPLSKNSPTKPRTEVMIKGYNYSSNVWQFEGYGYVPSGTSGVSIMQVFGASPPHPTTLQLRIYNGSLTYYTSAVLVPNIYDKWFRVNVIHDVELSRIKIYIDGKFRYEEPGRGGTFHYFKFGVYGQMNDSYYMESRWKDIKVFKKCN
ncbi:citrate-binding protein-like [Mangifera indica]|uniref:citrate-binding protein-like n=1 Tax=Mangifera indica TaxID=29780 RepID=UPI001CFA3F2B|nr:citrate-binding protein-like [Mangifera indica]